MRRAPVAEEEHRGEGRLRVCRAHVEACLLEPRQLLGLGSVATAAAVADEAEVAQGVVEEKVARVGVRAEPVFCAEWSILVRKRGGGGGISAV